MRRKCAFSALLILWIRFLAPCLIFLALMPDPFSLLLGFLFATKNQCVFFPTSGSGFSYWTRTKTLALICARIRFPFSFEDLFDFLFAFVHSIPWISYRCLVLILFWWDIYFWAFSVSLSHALMYICVKEEVRTLHSPWWAWGICYHRCGRMPFRFYGFYGFDFFSGSSYVLSFL